MLPGSSRRHYLGPLIPVQAAELTVYIVAIAWPSKGPKIAFSKAYAA
jgi:hypothetical protein